MPDRYESYLLIAAGGFAGACARYLVNGAIPGIVGILVINVAGCYLLGVLMYESIFIGAFSARARILCGAGFIGAFTTFSTFSLLTFEAAPLFAALNVIGSLALGLAAVYLGRATVLSIGGKAWKR